jgi:hypothetical protein
MAWAAPSCHITPTPEVAAQIDDIANDLRNGLAVWYDRDGELRVRVDVDGLRDTITIRVNAGIDLESE